jgi:hypothetical protein
MGMDGVFWLAAPSSPPILPILGVLASSPRDWSATRGFFRLAGTNLLPFSLALQSSGKMKKKVQVQLGRLLWEFWNVGAI